MVCIALFAGQLAIPTAEHATVEHLETRLTAHEDTPIIIGNYSLKYIVIQGGVIYGVQIDE